MRHSLGAASIRGRRLFHFSLLKCGVYWRAGFKRGNTVCSKHFLEISSVGLPFTTIVPIKMADALSMIIRSERWQFFQFSKTLRILNVR